MRALPQSLVLPPRVLSGEGKVANLVAECVAFGKRGLLVHGRSLAKSGLLDLLLKSVPAGMAVSAHEHAGGEPTLAQLGSLLESARQDGPDWIAAVGGGSVMDLAKACAGLLEAPLPPARYHDGAPLPPAAVPFVAVPTTAGTGSEATIVSVLTNEQKGVKKSIRHPTHMAQLVVLDPNLLKGCPSDVLAASGMDALTQGMESFVSSRATGITEAFSLQAVRLIARSLEIVYGAGDDARSAEARCELLTGSFLAGLALSNARLGLVHGLAHPLGCRYHAAHGRVCAICLPEVLDFNRGAMGEKYRVLSDAVGGDVFHFVRALLARLNVASPFSGKPLEDEEAIVRETLASGSTRANPRPVAAKDVVHVLHRLFRSETGGGDRTV